MSLFKNVFGNKDTDASLDEGDLIEVGVCPNCWGKQEYDGKYVAFVKDQTKSDLNHDPAHKKAFVQHFIETSVTGIRLKKEGDLQVCPTCAGKYKSVSPKAR